MDLPIEVINAVKDQPKENQMEQLDLLLTKPKKPYIKEASKRILHALGNGLRTVSAISNAINMDVTQIRANIQNLKARGLVFATKKTSTGEMKYYLTTDKPTLEKFDLTPKRAKKIAKNKKVLKLAKPKTLNRQIAELKVSPELMKPRITREQREVNSEYSLEYIRQLEKDVVFKTERLSQLELSLVEKEKEVWTLECEVFDKKAIVKYLEEKLFALGVK
jgi:predicted transcriptional regulator